MASSLCVVCMLLIIGHSIQSESKIMKCSVKLQLNICYSSEEKPVPNMDCNDTPICRKHFNITSVVVEPYTYEIVADMLKTCCGHCTNVSEAHQLTNISQLTPTIMENTNFVFPILGRAHTTSMYDYLFIPLVETTNVIYITNDHGDLLSDLILSCIDIWPLMIIALLMVVISGFICWLIETWGNKEEFPREFFIGWFDGMWWSFISMTTVGYGDKAPKCFISRIFSIIWIVVGITTFALITALLASEITAANSLPPPKMSGAKVGAIRHRLYESIVVAKNGGILRDIEGKNLTDGIHKMIHMLKNKRLDGFVVDRYTLLLFYYFFESHAKFKDDVKFLRTKTILTEIKNTDEFVYGALVKDRDDYDYLIGYVTDNKEVLNTCNSLLINNLGTDLNLNREKPSLFSTSGKMFWPSFITMSSITGAIICFGIVYELMRRTRARTNNKLLKENFVM